MDEDACYRVIDFLTGAGEELERAVYDQVVGLLNLEVDLLFFDITSAYFETEGADQPVWRDDGGRPVADTAAAQAADGARSADAVKQAPLRTYRKSKDSRDDLPQVVIGLAVTREAIPVCVWVWPGNTADSALIRQVRTICATGRSRIIDTADRGITSKTNRRELMRAGDGYILGEKLQSNSADAKSVLARPGKCRVVKDNLRFTGLLRTSHPHMSAEDMVLGYTQLLEVERGWRDMKPTLDFRPVYHRFEHRIRAHVQLCWLALLLIGHDRKHHRPDLERASTYRSAPSPTHPRICRGYNDDVDPADYRQAEIFIQPVLPAPRQVRGLAPATT